MKKHQEEAIDRVLRGLSAQSAPEELAQRTLQALHSRISVTESARPAHVWSRLWIPAAAAAAILAADGLLVAHDHPVPRRQAASISTTLPSRLADVKPLPLVRAGAQSPKHLPVLPRVQSSRIAQASGSVREASYPAPQRPLTSQEKALLEIAQNPTPDEIAMLDPVLRAKQAALEDAQFEKFVAQSDAANHP